MASSSVRSGLVVVEGTTTGGSVRAGGVVGVCASAAGGSSTTVSAAKSGIRIGGGILESGSPARTRWPGSGFHALGAGTAARGDVYTIYRLRSDGGPTRYSGSGARKTFART